MTNAEAIEILRANYPDACFEQLREAVDAAIEALKARDAAGDTISRQAAIDAVGNMLRRKFGIGGDLAEITLTGLPTIDAVPVDDLWEKINEAHNEGFDVGYWAGRRDYEPKWVPVTERLPEKYIGEWLCCTDDGKIMILPYDTPGDGSKECVFYAWDDDGYFYQTFNVTHWMPLPKPPKEG